MVYNYFKDTLDILHEVTIFSNQSVVRYDSYITLIRSRPMVDVLSDL